MSTTEATDVGGVNVSRETLDALHELEALVRRWTPAINLVSKATVHNIWHRHIVDSAQIYSFYPPGALTWVDLGSGAGFPGLVVAILAKEKNPDLRVTLVEADLRKATFLRQAAQTLELPVAVIAKRIEALENLRSDVLSARALAPLSSLLSFAHKHMSPQGTAIFPKGAQYKAEIAEARKAWLFDIDTSQSLSEAEAAILVIRNIHRAHD